MQPRFKLKSTTFASSGVIHKDALTVNGRTLGDNVKDAKCWNPEVITSIDKPFKPHGGIAVLRGNLAPRGAVIKPSAASPHLMRHKGMEPVHTQLGRAECEIIHAFDMLCRACCGFQLD